LTKWTLIAASAFFNAARVSPASLGLSSTSKSSTGRPSHAAVVIVCSCFGIPKARGLSDGPCFWRKMQTAWCANSVACSCSKPLKMSAHTTTKRFNPNQSCRRDATRSALAVHNCAAPPSVRHVLP
jgi:hypothetical protein